MRSKESVCDSHGHDLLLAILVQHIIPCILVDTYCLTLLSKCLFPVLFCSPKHGVLPDLPMYSIVAKCVQTIPKE